MVILALLVSGAGQVGRAGAAPGDPRPAASAHASDGSVPRAFDSASKSCDTQSSSSWLEGIDVSHWNGTIDWSQVASSGKRFAMIKATDGRTGVDPTYTQNRQGAVAAGLKVSAYHFAEPDPSTGDAVAEADHFVDTAGIGVGNIIPALDLERNQYNLSAGELIAWTQDWLDEVKARTGISPMIYTGPYRWSTVMGDTEHFADEGFRLWLAHWTTGSPWVPANDWGGHGWTFWQYTDCGTVPGISGGVDLDHFDGTSLTPVVIPRLTVTTNQAGVVTSTPAGIDCGSICRSAFDPGSVVTLTATPARGAVFLQWGRACSGSGDCTVTMIGNHWVDAVFGYPLTASVSGTGTGSVTSSPAGIVCGSSGEACSADYPAGAGVTLTATPDSGSQFSGWSSDCSGWEPTCTVSMEAARTVTASFADDTPPDASIQPPTRLGGRTVAVFDEPVHGVSASNFVLRVQGHAADLPASVSCLGQDGQAVSCATGDVARAVLTPDAQLVLGQYYRALIDPTGVSPKVVDQAGNPAAQTALAFRAVTSIEELDLRSGWRWRTVWNSNAHGGSYAIGDDAGASASARFTGPNVTWITALGPGEGKARVLVDGRAIGIFDLSANTWRLGVRYWFGHLGGGLHTIRVLVLGRLGAHGPPGTAVAVDGFLAGGSEVPASSISYRWVSVSASGASAGRYAVDDDQGASLLFRFRGTGIRWSTVKGPDQGRAAVYVDGRRWAVFDGFAPDRVFGISRLIDGLTEAVHSIRIEVLATARPAATGTAVAVDAFGVG